MKRNKYLVTFLLLFVISSTAFSQNSTSKIEKIKTLLELTGSAKQSRELMDVMINSLTATSSNLPREVFLESIKKEINFNELINEMVPIYHKHFTEADVDGMIKFYQSDVGKKMIDKMPSILAEYMPIIKLKMGSMTERVMKSLKEQQEKKKP